MPANEVSERGGGWLVGTISATVTLVLGGLVGGATLYQYMKPAAPIPVLPSFTSEWVGGGHNPMEYCSPIQQSYRAQYPDFDITVQPSESSSKDWLGRVSYHYTCRFEARKKSS